MPAIAEHFKNVQLSCDYTAVDREKLSNLQVIDWPGSQKQLLMAFVQMKGFASTLGATAAEAGVMFDQEVDVFEKDSDKSCILYSFDCVTFQRKYKRMPCEFDRQFWEKAGSLDPFVWVRPTRSLSRERT